MSFSVVKRNKAYENVRIRIFMTYVVFINKTEQNIHRSNHVIIRYDTVFKKINN